MKQFSTRLLFFLLIVQLGACVSAKKAKRDLVYFQDSGDTVKKTATNYSSTEIQPNDQLLITVLAQSLNQEHAEIFNLQSQSSANSGTSGMGSSNTGTSAGSRPGSGGSGYLVDFEGNIELPFIGKIHAAGITKDALADTLRSRLSNYIKDPLIIIRYANYKVDVLGEVKSPGPKYFPNEKVNVLDAIGSSGDLTDRGYRKDVMVIRRQSDGTHNIRHLDLTHTSVYNDPYFQLQQNDLVYVRPHKNGLKAMYTNPTVYRDIPIMLSIITIITTTINILRINN